MNKRCATHDRNSKLSSDGLAPKPSIAARLACLQSAPVVTCSLVIPVYNECEQLERSVRQLLDSAENWRTARVEVIIANNGSTDGTTEIAERLAASIPNVRHEYLSKKGRGRALRQAWMRSDADILAYMDVDLSTDISFFPALIEPLTRGEADLAVGSRLLRPEWTARGWRREFISRRYNKLLRAVFDKGRGRRRGFFQSETPYVVSYGSFCGGLLFSDAQCGFKAITKRAAGELLPLVEDNEWFFDTELLLLADYFGYRIYDLPVRWKDDSDSRVKIAPTIIKDLKGILRMRRRLREMERGASVENPKRAGRAESEEVEQASGRGG